MSIKPSESSESKYSIKDWEHDDFIYMNHSSYTSYQAPLSSTSAIIANFLALLSIIIPQPQGQKQSTLFVMLAI